MNNSSLPVFHRRAQIGVWEQQCPGSCPAWCECGGSDSAPCGCIYIEPEKRYHCASCSLICRERRTPPGDVAGDGFVACLREGKPLELVALSPESTAIPPLPLFIPTRTSELSAESTCRLPWVGIDARYLFTRHKRRQTQHRLCLASPSALRRFLRIGKESNVLGVLNGNDQLLERFWGMARRQFFAQSAEAGIVGFTGPTFSVSNESVTRPAAHNVAMLLRHHRVITEISQAGLGAIPNLYWRAPGDLEKWRSWLRRENNVRTVSRDFSRTKQWSGFLNELAGLRRILDGAGRPLHVILVGVGRGKARVAMEQLAEVGSTCTLISAAPVMEAIKRGIGYRLTAKGIQGIQRADEMNQVLAVANIKLMGEYLREVADKLTPYESRFPSSNAGVKEVEAA